ncbi:ATP-grasp fold amidoligase family protein [Clostridium perfringens]|uniref:ATP-grasp fold amidoligase family protein n=1 Tax=Clostridium perfringens TaxID=1502 RepID=UPI0037EF5332|nr:ATP-grasp fold amidoligase family protein [Clostridium perfringens]
MNFKDVYRKIRYILYEKQEKRHIKKLENMPVENYPKELKKMYYKITGKKLDLENPRTYNEKIQWSKLFDSTLTKSMLADKYAVRKWVEDKIGKEYLIPLLGVWDSFDDIDFKKLPNQFVLKLNNGSATNIIVKNKEELDIDNARKLFSTWMNTNFAFKGLELHYKDIKPKIIAEKYMVFDNMKDLPDYKFFCFNGKVFCSYTMVDYMFDHTKGKLGFFDRDYKLMPYHRKDFSPITEQLEKPKNYELMVNLAEVLSEGFSHVRVDFYNIEGKIYFGEMTFTNASGYCQFEPDKFDEILGNQWNLDSVL